MDFMSLLPVLIVVVLAILNVPIWIAILGGMLPYFLFLEPSLPAQIIVQRIVASTESTSMLAIPFFVTAGCLMEYSGISRRLLSLADALVGHLPGGLGQVNVLLSVLMGGISGSAAADAAFESKVLVPEMKRHGYDEDFSAAVTVASSLLTPIIPPGMGLIIFAFTTQISVGRLLAAGYIPGFIGMILMMLYVHRVSKKRGYKGSRICRAPWREIGKLSLDAIWALLMPFGIIMGLRFGVVTANEAGAVCALYALIVGVLVYREIKLKHIWPVLKESVRGTAAVFVMIAAANVLSYYMTYERIPHMLYESIMRMNLNRYTFLLIVNAVLLVIGMFMDGTPAIIILAPLLMPVAKDLGIDPIHFGLMFVFNLGIGNMSPPFGVVLYQVSGLLGIKLNRLIKATIPFLIIMLITLMLVTFIPQISLTIPNLIYGTR